MSRRLAACALALLASGCATVPQPAAVGDWPTRRAELQSLERWTLNGRMAVAAGPEGFSGGMTWRQDGAEAVIELRGPIGGRAIRIRVADETLSVSDGGGTTLDGEQARALVSGYFGTDLPVAELRYWLVGVPAPGIPHTEAVGADQRLVRLDQAGWRIGYIGYRAAGELVLPSRMEITAQGLRLRLSVADWRIER